MDQEQTAPSSFTAVRVAHVPKQRLTCLAGVHDWKDTVASEGSEMRECADCHRIEQMVDEGGGFMGPLYERVEGQQSPPSWWIALAPVGMLTAALMAVAVYGR